MPKSKHIKIVFRFVLVTVFLSFKLLVTFFWCWKVFRSRRNIEKFLEIWETLFFLFIVSGNIVSLIYRHFWKVPRSRRNIVSPIYRHFSKVPQNRRNVVSPIFRLLLLVCHKKSPGLHTIQTPEANALALKLEPKGPPKLARLIILVWMRWCKANRELLVRNQCTQFMSSASQVMLLNSAMLRNQGHWSAVSASKA